MVRSTADSELSLAKAVPYDPAHRTRMLGATCAECGRTGGVFNPPNTRPTTQADKHASLARQGWIIDWANRIAACPECAEIISS